LVELQFTHEGSVQEEHWFAELMIGDDKGQVVTHEVPERMSGLAQEEQIVDEVHCVQFELQATQAVPKA
jgi:hypothetical protein